MKQIPDSSATIAANQFFGIEDRSNALALRPFLRLLSAHKLILLSTTLIGILLGFIASLYSAAPQYLSTLTLLINTSLPNVAMVGEGYIDPTSALNYRNDRSLDARIIQSRSIIDQTIRNLGLTEKEFELPVPVTPVSEFINNLSQKFLKETFIHNPQSDQSKLRFTTNTEASTFIQENLVVEDQTVDGLLDISFTSPIPQLSADVLNVLAAAYIDYKLSIKVGRVSEASSWLKAQMEKIRSDLTIAETSLQDFRSEQGTTTTRSIEENTDSRLLQLTASLQAAQNEYARLAQRYGAKHPRMIEAAAQVQLTQIAIQQNGGDVVADRGKEFELNRLEKDVENTRVLHDMFLRRYQEANISTDTNLADADVLEYATPATEPVSSSRSSTFAGGFLGFFFGALLIGLKFHLDDTFKSHHEVEQKLGLPVLSVLPRIKHTANAIESNNQLGQDPAYSEAINRIRSSLQYSNAGEPATLIQLTSSLPGEGKSTLALNLALSMAKLGKKTLIVDGDLRRPKLHSRIGHLKKTIGLSDLLAGTAAMRDTLQPCPGVPNLYVLAAGGKTKHPLELLASKNFKILIQKLPQIFDHIIIDSPPLLPIADALEIGRHMDAVLFVIEAGKTTTDAVKHALNMLHEANIQPLGAILSKLGLRSTSYYYPAEHYQTDYGT
ncbi:MAG: polysaccharide biosynthesis tyrosine autokinase [Proteobacteria bacterium]|jgi:polysaccharide biosynthesis transport protein|nr:polysaccharide biosynthesis tyrosine autokinase [Pseudomonadota bacterium]